MDGRCAVETWTQFGFCASSCSQRITFGSGPDVFICTGREEVYVFNSEEKQLCAVLHFPAPVSDLVPGPDKQLLYVSCRTGVYCVSLPFLLSRTQSSPPEASSSSPGPAELEISSEFLVVGEEDVLSLLLVDSVLLLLSQRDTCWQLTLYKTQSSSYEKLRSFSLPLVAHDGFRGRSVLTCVHCIDPTSDPTPSAMPASHFHLESVLFKLLFGIDATLIKSPVVLCGLPDGRLCFLPMRLPGPRLRVLHSLEQPIVFVGVSVAMETNPGRAQFLVAVGDQGRVVLLKANKGGSEGSGCTAGFIEGCVPGPVVCVSVGERHLYYSTGSDLLVLDLCEGLSGREGQEREEKSRQTAAALQSPTSLNVCRLVALTAPVRNIEGKVQLMGLSLRGQLQRIVLPKGSEDTGTSSLPSTRGGGSIRDLLSAIGDICERVSVLNTAVKSKNQMLQHLNQVLNISFLLLSKGDSKGHASTEERPIRCRAITGWSRLLRKDSLILTCVLENSSPYVLEGGWTLSVSVFPLSLSPSVGEKSSSASFSFPLQNLHPGETLDVTLPLVAAGDTCLPIRVTCSLIFSLSGLLGEEEMMTMMHFPDLQSCISLPLNTLAVDWLDALQVNAATDHPINKNDTTCHSINRATDTVRAFLNSHRTRGVRQGGGGGEGPAKAEREQYSARIRVSSEILRDTLVDTVDPQGPKLAPQNLCIALLDWLLSEGPGGGRVGQRGDKINSCVVQARGPNGEWVKLSAKEVNVAKESRENEKSLSAIEVCVDSSSIAAVCGLHHAVLQRIQTLLRRTPESATSTKRLLGLGLRQTLQRAEHLLQQIQQSRISGTSRGGMSMSQMSQLLLGVYQELRENPLLII